MPCCACKPDSQLAPIPLTHCSFCAVIVMSVEGRVRCETTCKCQMSNVLRFSTALVEVVMCSAIVLMHSAICMSSLFQGHSSPKQSAPEGGGGGGPGGGGGGRNWYNSEWWQGFMNGGGNWLLIGLSAGVVYLMMSSPTPTREISWQEFRRKYLERGEVGVVGGSGGRRRSRWWVH